MLLPMPPTNIVFVIGAGASPERFPRGEDLPAVIANRVGEISQWCNEGGVLEALDKYSDGERYRVLLETALERFRRSGCSSVDEYFGRTSGRASSEMLELAVAYTMLDLEDQYVRGRSSPEERQKDWVHELYRLGGFNSHVVGDPRVKVITFNYEHSLEWRLATLCWAHSEDGMTETQAATNACGAPFIKHVYGQLQSNWEHYLQTDGSGREGWLSRVQASAQTIRLVAPEGVRLSGPLPQDEQRLVKSWLKSASVVAFLGFGFHVRNLEYLGVGSPDWCPTAARLLSSRYKWDAAFAKRVNDRLGHPLADQASNPHDLSCADVVRAAFQHASIAPASAAA